MQQVKASGMKLGKNEREIEYQVNGKILEKSDSVVDRRNKLKCKSEKKDEDNPII